MVTNPKVKDKLINKLGVSQSAIYATAKRQYPILYGTEVSDAIYVLALDSGVPLKKLLGPEEAERIRRLHLEYNSSGKPIPQPTGGSATPKRPAAKLKVYNIPHDDPLLTDQIRRDAEAMANIYPQFYYLENSIRSFLVAAMEKYHGKDWWDKKVGQKLRDKVDGYKTKESKNEWHQRRGDRNIDYLDFAELKKLYNKVKAELVRDGILPNEGWLEYLIDEVYPSRCVVAHMNPLDADNIQGVKVKVKQWNKLIKAKYKDLQ